MTSGTALTKEQRDYLLESVIPYELVGVIDGASRTANPKLDQQMRNHVLDSFAIHARNLYDFFFPGPNRRVGDITADAISPGFQPVKDHKLDQQDVFVKASTLVAHISVERVNKLINPEYTEWQHWGVTRIAAFFYNLGCQFYKSTGLTYPLPKATPTPKCHVILLSDIEDAGLEIGFVGVVVDVPRAGEVEVGFAVNGGLGCISKSVVASESYFLVLAQYDVSGSRVSAGGGWSEGVNPDTSQLAP
jgi:hypothetical protein